MITAAKSPWAIPILGLFLALQAIAKEGPTTETRDARKLVEEAHVDLVYTRPGADLGVYQRIMMPEPEVAFRLSEAARKWGTL